MDGRDRRNPHTGLDLDGDLAADEAVDVDVEAGTSIGCGASYQGETRVNLDETLPFMACRKEGGARLRAGHERRRFLKLLLAVG
jgi:hypothetical protein